MGIFSSLFGSSNTKSFKKTNRVFMNRKAANTDILIFIAQCHADNKQVILVYFFKETKHEIEELYTNATNIIWVNGLFSSSIKNHLLHKAENTKIVFVEPYPDITIENLVLTDIEESGFTQSIPVFFHGLDDPLFKAFGGERIQSMMIKMGVKEDEPIEHTMITTSIERAQKKLSKTKLIGSRIDSRVEMIRQLG